MVYNRRGETTIKVLKYNLICNMYNGVRKQQHCFLWFSTVIDKLSKIECIFIFIGKLDDYLDCTALSLSPW